jgi:periplasmic protein TonB
MTANQILKADFLDILFEHRNKEYGAYAIRKAYPQNLTKALLMMLLFVLALCLYVISQPKKTTQRIIPIDLTPDHKLENLKTKSPEKLPQRSVTAQPPTRVDHQIKIIPDNQTPITPLIDRTDTSYYVPGSTNSPGTGDDGRDIVQGTPSTQTNVQPVVSEPEPPAILNYAEVAPEFPGGTEAWMNYLRRMLRVPDDLESGDRKTVKVKFVVNINGEVTDVEIIQSAGLVFDKEVIRVISKMPNWKAGKQKGKAVAVYFTQPVTFTSGEE